MYRIGFGYDAHRLVEGRPLILGGVAIPNETGLEGHSDADVLTHAVTDALIGALGKGDIGGHFPDTDPAYKNISSLSILKQVVAWVKEEEFSVCNLDATIIAQAPRLAPYIEEMRENLAALLETDRKRVNVKATTTEGMGFPGRGEGMEAYAVVSLVKEGRSAS